MGKYATATIAKVEACCALDPEHELVASLAYKTSEVLDLDPPNLQVNGVSSRAEPPSQDIDASKHLLLVKFGVTVWYPPKPPKADNKSQWVGYQNCGVKVHREAKEEYGRMYLRRREDAIGENQVYQCRCKYLLPTLRPDPKEGVAKPGFWRVEELVLKGRL
ncbi:DDX21 [Symbiodinium sp. CCMP2592]|nr:DDX21 [Symbiodinium sp. CCMP2592]CAE7478903.1 DDX21 [Symbiodinium sp. CCMP2592]